MRGFPFVLVVAVTLAEAAPPPHGIERERLLVDARDAVIQGDLDAARTAGKALAWELGRGQARDHRAATAVREAAVELADATNLDVAGRAVGEAVAGCAGCHSARGPLDVPRPEPPVEGDAVRAEMERHASAMDLLWRGVLAPSQDAVAEASERFSASTLAPPGPLREGARAADERVNRAVREVVRSPEGAVRGQAFAEVLLACAACHLARPDGIAIEPE